MLGVSVDLRNDLVVRRQRRYGMLREISAKKSQAPGLRRDGKRAGPFDCFRAVTVYQVEEAEERARRQGAPLVLNRSGKNGAGRPEMADALDQSENLDRRLLGKVGFDESPLPFAVTTCSRISCCVLGSMMRIQSRPMCTTTRVPM
jgi:hypothetical protein